MPATTLMPTFPFRWLVAAIGGGGLVPASGYKAKFFESGTLTAKTIYDENGTPYPSPSNTAVLNSEGYALIRLGSGGYKFQITKPDDTVIFTLDNVVGNASFGTGFASSIAELKTINTNVNTFTYVAGYYTPGDGGHGMFYNATSAAADDGGYVIASTYDVTKRWFRIPDEDGSVRAASFGFDQGTGSDLTTKMQAADAYAASIGATLRIAIGTGTAQIGAMTFAAPRVVFDGRGVKGLVAVPAVTFNGYVEGPPGARLFERMTVTLTHKEQHAYPEWWGAVGDGVTDDLVPVNAMLASGAEEFRFGDGDYEVSAPPTFPASGRIVSNGTVTVGATVHVAIGIRQIDVGGIIRAESLAADAGATAGTNVKAGQTAAVAGIVSQRVGTGTLGDSPAVSTVNTQTTAVATSGTGEDNLMSFTVPANSILADGDAIRVTMGGTFGGTIGATDTATLKVKLGGTTFLTFVVTGQAGMSQFPSKWKVDAVFIKRSGNMVGSGAFVMDGVYAAADPGQSASADLTSAALAMTSDRLLQVTGEVSDAGTSITQDYMVTEFIKAR